VARSNGDTVWPESPAQEELAVISERRAGLEWISLHYEARITWPKCTIGIPGVVAAMSWAEDVLDEKQTLSASR